MVMMVMVAVVMTAAAAASTIAAAHVISLGLVLMVLVFERILSLGSYEGTGERANDSMAAELVAKLMTAYTTSDSTHQTTVAFLARLGASRAVGRVLSVRAVRVTRGRRLVVRSLLGELL